MDASRSDKEKGAAKVTVEEAARTLGIEEESVRKRVSRGNMRFEKAEDGRHFVYVVGKKSTGNGYVGKSEDLYADRSVDETGHVVRELIASKDKTIRMLQDQLQEQREARKRADRVIAQLTQAKAALTQRVPELEAPRTTHQEDHPWSCERRSRETRAG